MHWKNYDEAIDLTERRFQFFPRLSAGGSPLSSRNGRAVLDGLASRLAPLLPRTLYAGHL